MLIWSPSSQLMTFLSVLEIAALVDYSSPSCVAVKVITFVALSFSIVELLSSDEHDAKDTMAAKAIID